MKNDGIKDLERQNFGSESLTGSSSQNILKASVYIDGFNFYHSIKDIKNVHLNKTVLNPIENYQSLSWVDLRKLSELYTKKYDLQDINFFTAFPKHRPKDQQYRHKIYIKTLKDYLKINIIEGKFRTYSKNENISCNHCNKIFNHEYEETTEKQTDTNMVAKILSDVFLDKVDITLIITNDSDIIPAINTIRTLSNKKVRIITPPSIEYIKNNNGKKKGSYTLFLSNDIKTACSFIDKITIDQLLNCMLPNEIPNLFDDKGNQIKNPYI